MLKSFSIAFFQDARLLTLKQGCADTSSHKQLRELSPEMCTW